MHYWMPRSLGVTPEKEGRKRGTTLGRRINQLHLVDLPGRGIPEASRIVTSVSVRLVFFIQELSADKYCVFPKIGVKNDQRKTHRRGLYGLRDLNTLERSRIICQCQRSHSLVSNWGHSRCCDKIHISQPRTQGPPNEAQFGL